MSRKKLYIKLLTMTSRDRGCADVEQEIRRLVSDDLCPSLFAAAAIANKTYPMVYANMKALFHNSDNKFCPAAIATLQRYTLGYWMPYRRKLKKALDDTTAILAHAQIPHVQLRGISFAEQFYIFPEMRVSEDIDMLVRAEHQDLAIHALLDSGLYRHNEPKELRKARAEYMGQTELIYQPENICMDLNWRLTGNAGIGNVSFDMDAIWERVQRDDGFLYLLSREDHLVDLVRHCGHGHDFIDGVLRCCADVHALLSTTSDWDHDYIFRQLSHAEACKVYNLFLNFFYNIYTSENRDVTIAPMPQRRLFAQGQKTVRSSEAQLFYKALVFPMILKSASSGICNEVQARFLECVGKFWMIDNSQRILTLLRTLVAPSKNETVLLAAVFNLPGNFYLKRFLLSITMPFAVIFISLCIVFRYYFWLYFEIKHQIQVIFTTRKV